MKDIFKKLIRENTEISHLKDALAHSGGIYDLSGATEAIKPMLIHGIDNKDEELKLVVTYEEEAARTLYEACRFFCDDYVYYPAKDLLFYQSDIHGNVSTAQRIKAIKAVKEGTAKALIVSIDALLNKLVSPEVFFGGVKEITDGDELEQKSFLRSLIRMGYEAVTEVEHRGEFSSRGGIIDVFPLLADHPYRIELWGDEVDSIRIFDEGSQKSITKVEQATIYPAMELVLDDDSLYDGIDLMEKDFEVLYEKYRNDMRTEEAFRLKSGFEEKRDSIREGISCQEAEGLINYFCRDSVGLLDYIGKREVLVFYDDAKRIEERAKTYSEEFAASAERRLEAGLILPGQVDMLLEYGAVIAALKSWPGVILSTLEAAKSVFTPEANFYIHASSPTSYRGNMPLLEKDLKTAVKNKRRVLMVLESRSRARHLAEDLMDKDFNSFYTEDREHDVHPGEIMIMCGALQGGTTLVETGAVILCERDVFGVSARRRRRRRKLAAYERIKSMDDLKVGDYVVHENHGLGIYQGMEKIERDHVEKDYIKIAYAKGSNLYILANQFDMIGKYSKAGDKKPKLSVLGSAEWSKTKSRVRGAVAKVADELVELYAARGSLKGYAYGKDTLWQQEFEEMFPFEETEGQLTAIADVKSDMESERIMDRLICGDVGYGKTEVALRAAFKAVQENKQVVYLCPTTILCRQHYNTFVQRMAGFPVNVGMLSRFASAAENKETAKKLSTGELDIVIGTHRALSKDVSFKDLGLLIIDEEQRFGVTHKEKIKQLRKNVDVISLSATPIPRTLHMSLVGIRDMSLLDEAPMERMPIQTYVFEQNDEMVREAITRELARGGQVYYVINRISGMDEVAAHIKELVPEAEVAYAHGRMNKSYLEDIMSDFISCNIDVLVATTIIEIGLDISNVNTIIIHDADKLGLSQLYQLRGRVGRSNRSAYAFLMYKRDKILREVAEKRLAAIREFTELGSGFKIAMRDLEIRGAGTMLGEAQSGHMEAVGYDLYCKLLSEAVKAKKGIETEEDFETVIDLSIDAYIPDGYISDEAGKLAMYRRIAGVTNEEEKDALVDEMLDRYGDPPKAIMNLLDVSQLRSQAHGIYVTEIKQRDMRVNIKLKPDAKIRAEGIPELVQENSPYMRFIPKSDNPGLELDFSVNKQIKKKDIPAYIKNLMGQMESALAV